jgi:hypothetical protein
VAENEDIELRADLLKDVTTSSFAQNINAFRSALLKYDAEIATNSTDWRRAVHLLREADALRQEVERQMKEQQAVKYQPTVPREDMEEVFALFKRIWGNTIDAISRGYPYIFGPQADSILTAISGLPDSAEKSVFLGIAKLMRDTAQQMKDSPATLSLFFGAFVKNLAKTPEPYAKLATQLMGAAPPSPPPVEHRDGGNEGGDMNRRVSNLERSFEKISEDVSDIKITLATVSQALKYLATKEDVASASKGREANVSLQGMASKEDLSPILAKIAEINSHLKHVPTKFGLLVAVAVPVASGGWWIFQQLVTRGVI